MTAFRRLRIERGLWEGKLIPVKDRRRMNLIQVENKIDQLQKIADTANAKRVAQARRRCEDLCHLISPIWENRYRQRIERWYWETIKRLVLPGDEYYLGSGRELYPSGMKQTTIRSAFEDDCFVYVLEAIAYEHGLRLLHGDGEFSVRKETEQDREE